MGLLGDLNRALSDRYRVVEEIGSGGTATVVRARDLKHDRDVAIKVLRPELASVLGPERFLQEVKIAASLHHPHILPLYDSGEAGGFLYYTMPLAEGESLRDRLTREEQLPLEDALRIGREVADALSYAHGHGVVHRDIKPENILLESGHAVVADFGIARAIDAAGGPRITRTGVALGTPAYMSPEQVGGAQELDGRSDLYSLGCVVYEMLAGQPPFTGRRVESVVYQHLTAEPPDITSIRPTVPTQVATTLQRALAKVPADRFPSAAQFGQALSPEQVSVAVRVDTRKRHRYRRLALTMVGVGAMAVGAVAMWQHWRQAADSGPPAPDRPFTVMAAAVGSADSPTRGDVEYLLRMGLDMSRVVQTVPSTEIERFLTLMDRPATPALDASTARELAQRYGVPTVVLPRVDAVGSGYLIAVRVEDVGNGALRAAVTRRAAGADQVVETVDAAVRELAHDLGESRRSLANTDRLPEVMTPSLEALRKYREGAGLMDMGDYRDAASVLREAVALDTAFAEAWAKLWAAYDDLLAGDSAYRGPMRAAFDQAVRFPDRLPAWRWNDLRGWEMIHRDIAQWDEGMDLRRRGSPNNYANMLGAFELDDSALNLQKRILADSVRHVRALDPSRVIEECSSGWAYATSAGRLEEWRAFRDSLGVTTTPSCAPRFDLSGYLAAGDWRRADSVMALHADLRAWAAPLPDAVRGRIAAALRAAPSSTDALLLDLVYGLPCVVDRVTLTGHSLEAVLSYLQYGLRSALCGDTLAARTVRQRLRSVRDQGTSERFERSIAPSDALLEAGPALRRQDWRTAIDVLRPVAARVRQPGYGTTYGGLGAQSYLVWWPLAEAYEGIHRPDSAVVYVDSIVAPPRSDWGYYGEPFPAAQFKLGQLYEQLGDSRRSIKHFTAFLDVFTDPDPQYVWMVKEAKAELERLRKGR